MLDEPYYACGFYGRRFVDCVFDYPCSACVTEPWQ
jgi:hypothetical protein